MTLSPLTPAFEARLRAWLPEATFRPLSPAYTEEPRGRYHGQVGLVVAPATTEEVAGIVRACAEARVAIVPWGGGTGLVAGQVAPDGPAPLLLSLERMRAIRGLWPEEGVIEVEAWAILADVQKAAEASGRLFPLSLASEGSARIGGLLA
ncbi:MAG: FAD-binding oxidoreductase, partial [Rhodobacteraceae bacterium]|nr:FAD-binding oxidoreductase [Paracoccaceae bacterium]